MYNPFRRQRPVHHSTPSDRARIEMLIGLIDGLYQHLKLTERKIMSKLDDTNASLATLTTSVNTLISMAQGDPATAAALQADEAGLDSIKAALDNLNTAIQAVINPPPPAA